MGQPNLVAVANQKGGVGKTTTTINLSACLAFMGKKVLIVDLDPQGNATSGLGLEPQSLEVSVYQVLLGEATLLDATEATSVRNLFIVPANLELADAEITLVSLMNRERRLETAFQEGLEDYDYVLVDCPPSLGLLTINALTACDEVLIPIQCEYYALEGVQQLLKNVNLVQENLNQTLHVGGVLLTMYDGRTNLSRDVVKEVRGFFPDQSYRAVIPRSVRLSEAPSYGEPIENFDHMSPGAISYRQAAQEFVERHQHTDTPDALETIATKALPPGEPQAERAIEMQQPQADEQAIEVYQGTEEVT